MISEKLLLATALAAQIFAGGDIEVSVETPMHEAVIAAQEHEHGEERGYYIVFAGMMLFGDEVRHGEALLDGNDKKGMVTVSI